MLTDFQSERRRTQGGYNIIEVLIAIALLGVVMVSIVTLFFMGRQNVYSGKQMTKAISVGTRIEEDLSAMTNDDVLANFGLVITETNGSTTVATTTASASVAGTTYSNCVVRDTNNISTTTDPGGYLAKWIALLPAADITSGKISLVFLPRVTTRTVSGTSTTYPETSTAFDTAPFLRIRIAVEWKEGLRNRSIVLDSAKNKRI
jgi:prepilin-type N-terminal cleavage/methylation domain-containing protein